MSHKCNEISRLGGLERFLIQRCYHEITGLKHIQKSSALFPVLNEKLSDIEMGIVPNNFDLKSWQEILDDFATSEIMLDMEADFHDLLADYQILNAINLMEAIESKDNTKLIRKHNDILAATSFRLLERFLIGLIHRTEP